MTTRKTPVQLRFFTLFFQKRAMHTLRLFEQTGVLKKLPRFCFTQSYEQLQNIANISHDDVIVLCVLYVTFTVRGVPYESSSIPQPDVVPDKTRVTRIVQGELNSYIGKTEIF